MQDTNKYPKTGKDYLGFVEIDDLAALVLTKGLKRKPSTSVFHKISDLFKKDKAHAVEKAISFKSPRPFYAIPLTASLAQVCHMPWLPPVCWVMSPDPTATGPLQPR